MTATTILKPSDIAAALISRNKQAESNIDPMVKYFRKLILRKKPLIFSLLCRTAYCIAHHVVFNKAMLIKHPMAMLVVNTKDVYDSEPAIIISDNRTDVLITRSGKLSSNKDEGSLLFIDIISIN